MRVRWNHSTRPEDPAEGRIEGGCRMRNPLLVPDLRELIQAGETAALRDFFGDHHPAHIAEMLDDLEPDEGDTILGLLATRVRAQVLSYVDVDRQVRIVAAMDPAGAAALLHVMS